MRQGQMRRLIACGAGLVLLLLLIPSAAMAKPDGTKRLQSALDRLVERVPGGPPGASIVIRKGGRQNFVTSGVANAKNGAAFTPDKHMRIASVSKAFSGAVSLSLVDAGELDLDESITARVPSLPPQWSTVTLRQLLNHTSGLPNYTTNPKFQKYFGNHLRGSINKQGLIDFIADKDLVFPAGSDYAYSNTDNIVIAMMAERASGFGYKRLLRRLVTKPLGMRQTALPPGFRIPRPQIHGYETNPFEDVTECCSMDFVSASGGIYSTPRQLRRFASGYGSGELFGNDVRAEQFRFVEGGGSEPPGPGENSAGLGIFRYQLDCGTVFGHTGNFPGYAQFIATTRNGNRSVVVSVNRQLAPDAPGVNAPEAFKSLRRVYRRAACTALR